MYKEIYDKLTKSKINLKDEWKSNTNLFRHRIKPNHQGGEYTEDNCTYLTLREHIIAHYLLWKINSHIADYRAYKMMSGINVPFTKHSEYTKQKISKSHKGVPLSKEHRKRISEGQIGRIGGMKGKHLTKEQRKKQSDALKGRKLSEKHKEKLSEVAKARARNINPKNNLGDGMLGKKHSKETLEKMRGQKRSEETKEKMRKAWELRRNKKN
jgi:hypothetical protein